MRRQAGTTGRLAQAVLGHRGHLARGAHALGLAAALLAGGGRAASGQLAVLHAFTGGADGANPYYGAPVIAGGTVYGTTGAGGTGNNGVVFAVRTDGTDFRVLHSFTGTAPDGAKPYGSVALSGTTLFGTTYSGGANANGTVFRLGTDGSAYATLHSFATDAAYKPYSTVTVSGAHLFGTTYYGSGGLGAIYRVGTNGSDYATLHTFAGGLQDGSRPMGGALTLSGTTLYGTALHGGLGSANAATDGTAFRIGTDGSGYSNLVSLTGGSTGANPYGSLARVGSKLYGTTRLGGRANLGTLFSVNTDGTGYRTLFTFTGGATNGAYPYCTPTPDGSALYGTTRAGGSANYGTLFKINLDGTGFGILHSFNGADGAEPAGDLALAGNTLYGCTIAGGASNKGTVFALAVGEPGYAPEGRGFVRTTRGSVPDGALFWQCVPAWSNVQPLLPYTNHTAFVLPACNRIAVARLAMTVWGGNAGYTCRMTVSVNGSALPGAQPYVFGTPAHSNSIHNADAPRAYGSGFGVWFVTVPVPAHLLRTDGGTNVVRVVETSPDGFDGRLHHVSLAAVYQSAALLNVCDYALAEGEALVYGTPAAPQVDRRTVELGPVGTNNVIAADFNALYTYGNTGQNDELLFNGVHLGGSDVAQWDASALNYGPSVVTHDVRGALRATNAVLFDVSAGGVSGPRETSLRPEFVLLAITREAPLDCRGLATPGDDGAVTFQWPGYASRTYTVEYSTNLLDAAGWSPLPGYAAVAGSNGWMTCRDAVEGPARFYRVKRR